MAFQSDAFQSDTFQTDTGGVVHADFSIAYAIHGSAAKDLSVDYAVHGQTVHADLSIDYYVRAPIGSNLTIDYYISSTTPAGVTQVALEAVVLPQPPALVTQVALEAVVLPQPPALVTQVAVEGLVQVQPPTAYVTQLAVEVLLWNRQPVYLDLLTDYRIGQAVDGDLDLDYRIGQARNTDLLIDYPIAEGIGSFYVMDWVYSVPTAAKELAIGYQFSETEAEPRVSVVVTVGGTTDITDDVVFGRSTWTMNAGPVAGTAQVWVRDPGHTKSYTVGQELWLDIAGQRVWGGYIMGIRRAYAFPAQDTDPPEQTFRYFVLECSDYNLLFQKRFVLNKAEPTQDIPYYDVNEYDNQIIKDLVEDYMYLDGDSISLRRVDHVGFSSDVEKQAPFSAMQTWGEAMRLIAYLPGAIYYIDPDKVLNYADVDVSDAPFKLSDQPDDVHSFGYREVEILMDGTNLCNDSMVWGAGLVHDHMAFARHENAESQAEHGLWQWSDYRQDLWKTSSMERRARTYVEGSDQNKRGHKDDAVSVKCKTTKHGLRAGMRVDFTCVVHGYQDVIPIRAMTITFSSPWNPIYELHLAHYLDEAWNTAEFWPDDMPVCEIPTPSDVTDPEAFQMGFFGNHTGLGGPDARDLFFWNTGDNPPAGFTAFYTMGPVEPFQAIHYDHSGPGQDLLEYHGFKFLGNGKITKVYINTSIAGVTGYNGDLTFIQKVTIGGADTTYIREDVFHREGGLGFVGFNSIIDMTQDHAVSYQEPVLINLFANAGEYGWSVAPTPNSDVQVKFWGEVIPYGGYQLSSPYTPGSLIGYTADGTEVTDLEEIDPATGKVFSPTAPVLAHICYRTPVGNGVSYIGGGDSGFVLPPPPGGSVYRPAHVRQLGWGSSFDSVNCTMAAACIALDRHTMGQKTSNPPLMRSYQYDQSGGTDLGDARIAWHNGYNEHLLVYFNTSWQNLLNLVNSGRGVIMQGLYRYIPDRYSAQPGFDGGHAMYLNEISGSMGLVYDPLARSPRWIPLTYLENYAKSYTGGNGVHCAATRITS